MTAEVVLFCLARLRYNFAPPSLRTLSPRFSFPPAPAAPTD